MSYEEENKAKIRELDSEQLEKFIKDNKYNPKELRVLCFPGKDCREMWVYEEVGILSKNIYCIERDQKKYEKLYKTREENIIKLNFMDTHKCMEYLNNGTIPQCDILSLDLMCGPKLIHKAICNAIPFMKDKVFITTNCADDGRTYMDKEQVRLMENVAKNIFPNNMYHYNIKNHFIYLQTTQWLKNFFNIENEIPYLYYGKEEIYSKRYTPMKGIIATLTRKRPSKILRTSEEVVNYNKKLEDKIFKTIEEIRIDLDQQSYEDQEKSLFKGGVKK